MARTPRSQQRHAPITTAGNKVQLTQSISSSESLRHSNPANPSHTEGFGTLTDRVNSRVNYRCGIIHHAVQSNEKIKGKHRVSHLPREASHERVEATNCSPALRFASGHLLPAGTERDPRRGKVPSFCSSLL